MKPATRTFVRAAFQAKVTIRAKAPGETESSMFGSDPGFQGCQDERDGQEDKKEASQRGRHLCTVTVYKFPLSLCGDLILLLKPVVKLYNPYIAI